MGAALSLTAQAPTGVAVVDSANVARSAWRRGQLALRAGDTLTSLREIAHAAAAWPAQPVYVWGHAQAAARARDTAGVVTALTRYADYALGADITSDAVLAPFARLAGVAPVAARLLANARPLARSGVRVTFPDSSFWPEGMDHDPRTGRWYAASIRHGTIAELGADGSARELWQRAAKGMGALLAVRVDTARSVLWATTSGLPQTNGYTRGDSAIAALLEVRPSDGAILRRWDLPVIAGGHTLGDIAVGAGGEVFMTDSNEPVLYRLRSERDTLERITSPLFRSLQGIAPTRDGRVVYVADYSHGILRLDLSSGAVTRVEDAPRSTTLGCDGIVLYNGAIIAVQNGVAPARVMRFVLDASGTRFTRAEVLDRNSEVADEPTIGTIVGDAFVYVANSQWEKYTEAGVLKPGVKLTPPVLLSIPLRARAASIEHFQL
jgi:sugar lactone lactonase YvrE